MTTTEATTTAAAFAPIGLYDLLWQVGARAHLLSEEAFANTPLTPASASLLAAIVAEPGMSVAEISRRIPKTPQTLAQVVTRLQKLELIERRVRSGRGIGLHPTDAGVTMAARVAELEAGVEARLRSALGAERADELQRLLMESQQLLSPRD